MVIALCPAENALSQWVRCIPEPLLMSQCTDEVFIYVRISFSWGTLKAHHLETLQRFDLKEPRMICWMERIFTWRKKKAEENTGTWAASCCRLQPPAEKQLDREDREAARDSVCFPDMAKGLFTVLVLFCEDADTYSFFPFFLQKKKKKGLWQVRGFKNVLHNNQSCETLVWFQFWLLFVANTKDTKAPISLPGIPQARRALVSPRLMDLMCCRVHPTPSPSLHWIIPSSYWTAEWKMLPLWLSSEKI